MISEYFNRDDGFQPLLERFNDEFPLENELSSRFRNVADFIEECGFSAQSRVWRKADLLTLIIELDQALSREGLDLQPETVVERLTRFYSAIDNASLEGATLAAVYYKAALQASNDRINRVRRGVIVSGLLRQFPDEQILELLQHDGLIG
jgi:hypothetical protein